MHPTATRASSAVRGFKPSFDLPKAMVSSIWAGIVWRGGYRRADNFLHSDWAVLDFDSGEMTLREAICTWVDCIHVVGTTKSHQLAKDGRPPVDRFRVAIPWDRRITDGKTYRYNMVELTEKYPADTQCKDAARLYYPCTAIVSQSDEGYRMDVKNPPDGWGTPAVVPESARQKRHMPWYLKNMMKNGAAPGTIRAAYFKFGAECHKWGFTLGESVEMAAKGRIGEHATAADPLREMYDCVSDGWNKDARKGGMNGT